MKTSLRQNLGTSLSMTPQLVQSIRLLQLSALELDQEILQALERNVMLEPADSGEDTDPPAEASADTATPDADPAPNEAETEPADENLIELSDVPMNADSWTVSSGREAPESPAPEPERGDLCAVRALEMSLHNPKSARLATAILESIDDNGYLETGLPEILERLPQELGARLHDLEVVLATIQRIEGSGYGARDLRECLLLQIGALPENTPGRALAELIVSDHLNDLAAHGIASYTETLDPCTEPLATAQRLIRGLRPKPAAARADADYIVPDLAVVRSGHHWKIFMNRRGVPRIRINKTYEQLLGRCGEGGQALRQQLQEARWLLRGLEMREDTLTRAARVIFERQKDFLEHGDEGLKPLTLRTVADAIGMHESTVSRITTRKYVQTPRGIFELKHFFGGALTGREGVEASGRSVRATIRKLIERETAPLCDGAIATLLARQGIRIARRTVAKYREAMHIPSAKQRGLAALATA